VSGRRKRIVLSWLAGWTLLMAGGGWLLADLRDRVLDAGAQAEARQEWQTWKEAVERGDAQLGPVARRPLKSDEPPAVVLLRDHFAAVAAGCGVFVSLTYLFLAVTVTGLWSSPTHGASSRPAPSTHDRQ
jgi:hypothetical protein